MLAPETAAIRIHKYSKLLQTNVTRLEFLNFDVNTFWKPISRLSWYTSYLWQRGHWIQIIVQANKHSISISGGDNLFKWLVNKDLYGKVHKSSSFLQILISNLKNSCDDMYLGNVFLIICDSWDWLMLPQGKSALKWFQRVTISNSVNLVILTSWSYSSLVSSEPPAPGTLVSSWHVMITDTPLIFTCRPAPGTRGPLIVILATEFTEDISTSERKQKTVCQLDFLRPLHHISVSVNREQQTWCTKIHFVYCRWKYDFYMAIFSTVIN